MIKTLESEKSKKTLLTHITINDIFIKVLGMYEIEQICFNFVINYFIKYFEMDK